VTASSIGLPAAGFRRGEIHVHGGAGGIVGIKQSFDGPFAHQRIGDPGGDAFAGHVGQFLVPELGGIRATLADQTGIEPLFGDALELTEQVQLGFFARVTPFGVEQALGEVKQQRGAPRIFQVFQAEVYIRTDDAGISGDRRTN